MASMGELGKIFHELVKFEEWGINNYVNMQTKNLVSNRDASKLGKILVFKFPNDFGSKI